VAHRGMEAGCIKMRVLHLDNQDATGAFSLADGSQVVYQKVGPALAFGPYQLVLIPRGLQVTAAVPSSPNGLAERRAFLARLLTARRSGTHVCAYLDVFDTRSDFLFQELIPPRVKPITADTTTLVSTLPELQAFLDV